MGNNSSKSQKSYNKNNANINVNDINSTLVNDYIFKLYGTNDEFNFNKLENKICNLDTNDMNDSNLKNILNEMKMNI